MQRTRWTTGLFAVVAVACGLGAFAQPAAGVPIDEYAEAFPINTPGTELPREATFQYFNSTATTQSGEPLECNGVAYGATLWAEFYPDRPGVLELTAPQSDFQMALSVMRFEGTVFSGISERECTTAIVPMGTLVYPSTGMLHEGQGYKVQVGSVSGTTGTFTVRSVFHPDSDRDGVLDRDDSCPNAGGPNAERHQGCPDTDGDGIPDISDRCTADAGPGAAAHQGCRDTDGDGRPDVDDACPTTPGNLANGCPSPPPRPDADGDGIFDDGPDQCRGENSRARDANSNGCLDYASFSPTWIFKVGGYFGRRGGRMVSLGVSVRRLSVSGVPQGARVEVTCTRSACRRMVKTARSRVTFGRLRGKDLRAGVRLTIRVTAPGFVGRARVYRVERNDVAVASRCLQPGSSRLRRSCSAVR
jgi:Thrombospondin type 3 repeat